MHIEPNYTLPLVYQLADPSDAGTYYVRAVIRNTLNGATIKTVNLTQGTGGRFTNSTLSPNDPTGQGFFIDVTITVYTDSGYSVLSDAYRRETTTYLVRKAQQSWGSGGDGVDYNIIREIIKGEIGAGSEGKGEIDFSPVLNAIADVKVCVEDLEQDEDEDEEEGEEYASAPLMQGFADLKNHVTESIKGAIEAYPQPPKHEPILEALQEVKDALIEHIGTRETESTSKLIESLNTIMSGVNDIKDNYQQADALKKVLKMFAAETGMEVPPLLKKYLP